MSWPIVEISEVANTQYGYTASAQDQAVGPKFLRITDIVPPTIDWTSVPYCQINELNHERYRLRSGDIVVARTGATTGYAKLIRSDHDSVFASYLVRFRVNDNRVDEHFLGLVMESESYKRFIKGTMGGAAQPNANAKTLARFPLPLPPRNVQSRVVSILSAYDDLIENNRRRIALLEEAARLLYREWFVHFRFPGHEHVEIIDGLPEGWERAPTHSVASTYDDGDWLETKDQGGNEYRILQISNIGLNAFIETGNHRFITEETFRRLNCHEVMPGDILISRMPKPIGRGWMVTEMPFRMVTAVDVTIVRADQNQVDPFYLLYHINSEQNLRRCEGYATGTTRPRITRRSMGSLPIILPPLRLQHQFTEVASENNRLRASLDKQNQKLAQARDLLLPRLMNGEIAV